MSYQPKGKHVIIDPEHPQALGICDRSGFVFLRKDMVRQMEWRGDDLAWTGFFVGVPYLDMPNEQGRPPILPSDPIPIRDPRPPFYTLVDWNQDQDIFSQDAYTFDSNPGLMSETPALPEQDRLKNLQTFNWNRR